MRVFATLWVAALNLVVLVTALAWTPAFWSDATHWLQSLPWASFGTEVGGLLQMHTMAADAVWALWLCVSAVLWAGALAAYGLMRRWSAPVSGASLPTPEVLALFDHLSGSLQGLEGFGDHSMAGSQAVTTAAKVAPTPPVLSVAAQQFVPATLANALQNIDPELGSRYASILRQLNALGHAPSNR